MPAPDLRPFDKRPEAGFRAGGEVPASLQIEAWGYWTPEIADAFVREAPALVQKLGASASFVLQARELKPQGAEGQDALRVFFRGLAAANLGKATIQIGNILTRMQLTRLLRECGLDGRVAFE